MKAAMMKVWFGFCAGLMALGIGVCTAQANVAASDAILQQQRRDAVQERIMAALEKIAEREKCR